MELSKNYTPSAIENKWNAYWLEHKLFEANVDATKPSYTIVIPPPNVTGILHMGHALNNTVQDILIRNAKLHGFNTCWVPGTDHASIATEAKVVHMLKEQGIDKNKLSREEFLNYAWQWKEKYGGIILQQLKKLGCALDWNRTAFTMDDDYYSAVVDVFIDLYNKGKIYRGVKMINWDPSAKTALSDEEVIFKETNSKLVYIKYQLEDEPISKLANKEPSTFNIQHSRYITIATVRPETILGDVAICVHPEDERYKHLVGTHCYVPLINRKIPIITDDYIDIEFGTGCLKVTPAHDLNDYNLGLKHKLPVIDTLNDDGTMSEAAQLYIGEDRFDVRKKIIDDLEKAGHIEKVEEYKNQVGHSERTNAVIEPRLSMQWWCNVESMAKPALDVVVNDDIQFYPAKFKNTYKHWMENIKDWCISRQLWWGHRIPAWYDDAGNMVIAKTEIEAKEKFQTTFNLQPSTIKQDNDVLDTWFSSWLWPMEVFGWNKNKTNEELNYFYPTATLVTGPDIIFFWVARMIMAGLEYRNQIPFKQVYFTGIVRDKQGRKMSKQLGNSPDLLELIENYGADAVRFGVIVVSPAGNDVLFDETNCEQGRNYCNKLWNALKLLQILKAKPTIESSNEQDVFASTWFEQKLELVKQDIDNDIKEFKLSEALKKVYSLIWDDYCSWYLEFIKTNIDAPIVIQNVEKALYFFEELLKMLHPFMPFITEEIYSLLQERKDGDCVFNTTISANKEVNTTVVQLGNTMQEIITNVRDARVKNNLKPKDAITLHFQKNAEAEINAIKNILQKQCNASNIEFVHDNPKDAISFVVGKMQCFITTEIEIDKTQQIEQLKKDLQYYQGFLKSVDAKLSNEKFVANAKPEVVAMEQQKKSDALEKIALISKELGI